MVLSPVRELLHTHCRSLCGNQYRNACIFGGTHCDDDRIDYCDNRRHLPHFGIDLFGGVVSAIAVPSFIILFGYSLLKYRIMELRTFMSRAIGYFLLVILLVTIYFLSIELAHRFGAESPNSAMAATAMVILVYASTGKVCPQIFEKLLTRREPNYFITLEKFSNEVMRQLNEQDLMSKTEQLCLDEFKSSSADVVDRNELEFEDPLHQIALRETVLESEVIKRRFGIENPVLSKSELIVPLLHDNTLIGAPVGIEVAEQARQCVRMACEMQRRLKSLNKKWLERGFLYRELSCRIGIHTGEAIVGSFGSMFRVDYTAIGSSVNLASRLEGACRPGKILVSRQTRDLLGGEFDITPIGWVTLKGFSNPVEAFELDPASKA